MRNVGSSQFKVGSSVLQYAVKLKVNEGEVRFHDMERQE